MCALISSDFAEGEHVYMKGPPGYDIGDGNCLSILKCIYGPRQYNMPTLCDLYSSGSPGVHPTPGLTSSTQVVCVMCTREYKHTHTHHPNTRKYREIYKTKPLSLPLQKHSLPRQQQALTMNKLAKPPLPIPSRTCMQVL